ncbi:PAF1 family protein [Abortiporus biennis]
MSYKKSKLDLLVRVRYTNPLPAPPCPPKLLHIPTDPMRYAKPSFLNDIANDTPLPMIVDAECGMPLDLGKFESLWEEGGDDSELNPDPNNLPTLDPEDQFLLQDPSTSSLPSSALSSIFISNYAANSGGSGTSTPTSNNVPNVTWLRKTEYLSRDSGSRSTLSQEIKPLAAYIDVSRSAQLRDIDASFQATEGFDLDTLKHPNKPNVTAVESYEIFPDANVWANAYDLFRFSERPGERPPDVEDPRLDCAILRPMESEGDHFLSFYLTRDDEDAIRFKEQRRTRDPDDEEEEEPTVFSFVRDYEVVKIEQEVPNEFLLVIDDGDEDDQNSHGWSSVPRKKGAYYKNIERKMLLKKKRQVNDTYVDKWDVARVTHVPMSKEEKDERDEAIAEVMDPMYLLGRGEEADAEGEIEEDVQPGEVERSHYGNGSTSMHDLSVDVFGE